MILQDPSSILEFSYLESWGILEGSRQEIKDVKRGDNLQSDQDLS